MAASQEGADMLEELSPPSIRASMRITPSGTLETEEDSTAGWAIPDSFPPMQMPVVDECDSPNLVQERMSTGTDGVSAGLDMFDGMIEQDHICFVCS